MQKDIDFFRSEYKKQKKLENFVNNRTLSRPKTKRWQVTALYVTLPFLLLLSIFFTFSLKIKLIYQILLLLALTLLILETHLRFCFIATVKCYQHYATEETRRRCKCIPSCSEYAILALKKVFPLLCAMLKIRKRLFKTCNGEAYKIDFPLKKMGEDFENTL